MLDWDEDDQDMSDDFYADDEEGFVYCVICGRDVAEPDYNDYLGMCIDCSEAD